MQKKETMMLLKMIQEATQWLLGLTESAVPLLFSGECKSLRIFTEDECESLSLPCRRFLLALEQLGIVNPDMREKIIHHAMQLQIKDIDLHVLEGITRIILSRRPENAEALKRMELLLTETENRTFH